MKKIIITVILFICMSTQSSAAPSPWAEEEINQLIDSELLEQEVFSNYQGYVTREAFMYMLVKSYESIVGFEIQYSDTSPFTDTESLYVLKATSIGLTSGVGNNKFNPGGAITREQFSTFRNWAIRPRRVSDTAMI